jgi:hypothetical protein
MADPRLQPALSQPPAKARFGLASARAPLPPALVGVALYAATRWLAAVGRLSGRSLVTFAGVCSAAVGVLGLRHRPFGWTDALAASASVGGVTFALMAMAVGTWWWLARGPPKPSPGR